MITKEKIKNLMQEKKGIASLVLRDAYDAADYTNQTQAEFQEYFTAFFDDVLRYGVNDGSVTRLAYYDDTHAFFDEHYNEIEELGEEWGREVGEGIKIHGVLKDCLAKFAYMRVVDKLAIELGIE